MVGVRIANKLRPKHVSEDLDRRSPKERYPYKVIRRERHLRGVRLGHGLEGFWKYLVGYPCFVFFVVVRGASVLF